MNESLTTHCPHCKKTTKFKHYNSPSYWYCFFCKGPLSLNDLTQLHAQEREVCLKSFPDSTHFIKVQEDSNVLLFNHEKYCGMVNIKV